MPVRDIGTANKLFEAIDCSVSKKRIPWSNVNGFETHTTNVKMGKHNLVICRIRSKQPNVFSQGCVCHLSNLCLLAASEFLPIDVDDLFVDLYYYFDKSAKPKEEFREFNRDKRSRLSSTAKLAGLV